MFRFGSKKSISPEASMFLPLSSKEKDQYLDLYDAFWDYSKHYQNLTHDFTYKLKRGVSFDVQAWKNVMRKDDAMNYMLDLGKFEVQGNTLVFVPFEKKSTPSAYAGLPRLELIRYGGYRRKRLSRKSNSKRRRTTTKKLKAKKTRSRMRSRKIRRRHH